jgi:N-acetylglucosaminyl-diphospho-decaprenol L-rhamnosyltransferase
VVDNASTDDSVALAERLGAETLRLQSNIGFAGANNKGLDVASSPFVAFVNPDVTVDYSTLDTLSDLLRRRDVLAAPQLTNPDGTVQPSARGLPFLVDKLAHRGLRFPGARLEEYVRQPATTEYIAWAMGAAVTGRTATLRRLGGWNPSFFIYYEDHELGLRAWRRGVPVVSVPEVRWTHGWARETTKLHAAAWRHELGSAARFYREYPELLLPLRRLARRRHGAYAGRTGRGEDLTL